MVESHVIDNIAACGETDYADCFGVHAIPFRILADICDGDASVVPRHLTFISLLFGDLRVLFCKLSHTRIPPLVAIGMVGHIFCLLIIGTGECGPVFEDEGCYTVRGEPFGHVGSLLMPGQGGETSAGAYDDGSAGLSALCRKISPQLGVNDVQDAFAHLAGIHRCRVFEKELLLRPILAAGSLPFVKTYLFSLREDAHPTQGKRKQSDE